MRSTRQGRKIALRRRLRFSGLGPRVSLGLRRSDFGYCSSRGGFTLMEMLLALAVSAIVLAGIGGVFFSAIRLRERTMALVDESVPLQRALGLLRRDLRGALPPGGVMVGDFKVGPLNSGVGQSQGIQFTTTTGVISDDGPWGDLQEVTYELREPAVRSGGGGKDLIRSTSRNLLSAGLLDYNEQWLMGNVQSLECACYDGMNWSDLWDTSLTETNLPAAVRVRIQLVADEKVDVRNRQPIEMIVPMIVVARTNQTQQATGGVQ